MQITKSIAIAILSLTAITANATILTLGTDVVLGNEVGPSGSIITYTITSTLPAGLEDNGNGDLGINLADANNGNQPATFTITFSEAVDLTIDNTTTRFGNVFDEGDNPSGGPSGEFITNGSDWAFTPGTNTTVVDGQTIVNNGSSFEISQTNGGSTSGSELDWGQLNTTGVTTLTWNVNLANREVVNFSAVAAAVPEPSSTALLGLGGLALLARRRRA